MGYYGGGRLHGVPLPPRGRGLLGRFTLGQLDPASIADSIMAQTEISNTPGFTQDVWNDIQSSAQSGQIEGFVQPCANAGQTSNTAQLAAVSGGIAVSVGSKVIAATAPALAAGPVGIVVMAVGALIGLFASLFEEHARAVAKEQQVECAAVPAFNDGANAISVAVQNGTLTPSAGSAAAAQLLSEFATQISQIEKNDAQNCNAGCVWHKCAQAAVAGMQAQFAEMESAQAASATSTESASGSAVAPASDNWFADETIIGGIPNFLIAGAALLVLVMVTE